ncbi:DUF3833 domain-containing protein [Shimia biformata]|uniref:DUF3833 domain-containing protein n=1 Tax=Shimia biformata TaxID=1294299 RepID=UPI001951E817|nr:DUF3833 domain-containing protein [Shimia biformata]
MRLMAILMLVLLSACGRPSLGDAALSRNQLNIEDFFVGHTVAHGQFQDVFGTVRERFRVEINGTWDGRVLTLIEDFVYSDGREEQRIWTLTKTGDQTWEGMAPGVQGVAKGEERGDAFNWTYIIDLPLAEGDTMRVAFDDWMWLLSEDRLLNRAYMSRFGVPLGEVLITFEKHGT